MPMLRHAYSNMYLSVPINLSGICLSVYLHVGVGASVRVGGSVAVCVVYVQSGAHCRQQAVDVSRKPRHVERRVSTGVAMHAGKS